MDTHLQNFADASFRLNTRSVCQYWNVCNYYFVSGRYTPLFDVAWFAQYDEIDYSVFRIENANQSFDFSITPIVLACMNMAKTHTGALIVIEREMSLGHYVKTGEMINAEVSTRLIENVFFKNSPLHDGAMVISHKKIIAAGCILPVSQNPNIPKQFGLRHRAGLGISQETDALIIIVSEERGKITFIRDGHIYPNITPSYKNFE